MIQVLEKNRKLLKKYLREKANRGYSEKTIRLYRVACSLFLNFLDHKDLSKIEKEDIEKYLEYLRKRRNLNRCNEVCSLKLHTVKYYLIIASLFLEWLEDNGIVIKNPAKKIAREIRVEKTKRKALSLGDVRKLVRNASNPRDRAIILTMAIAGLRRSEVSSLRMEDVCLETSEIFVRLGKGKKDRIVVMDDELIETLKVWLVYRESMNPKTDYLFCNLNGNDKLGSRGVYFIVRKTAEKAGIAHAFPHRLRHSAATFMNDSGIGLLDIKEQLGHTNISTTEGYIDANEKKRKQEMSRMPSLNVLG